MGGGVPLQIGGVRGPAGYAISGVSNGGRAYVITGVSAVPVGRSSITVTTPTAGGDVDGVAIEIPSPPVSSPYTAGLPACKGYPVQVEAGGSVTAGTDLQVQGDGQFVTASGGVVVARALEGASAGQHFWAVWA